MFIKNCTRKVKPSGCVRGEDISTVNGGGSLSLSSWRSTAQPEALHFCSCALHWATVAPLTLPELTALAQSLFWIAQARCTAADLLTKVLPLTEKGRVLSPELTTGGARDATDGAACRGSSSAGGSSGFAGGGSGSRRSGRVNSLASEAAKASLLAALATLAAGSHRRRGGSSGGSGAGGGGARVAAGVAASIGVTGAAASIGIAAAGASDGEVAAIVLGTALGHGHQHGLVVGGTGHAADAVVAAGQAAGDGGGQQAVAVAGVVDALEEDELGGVERGW